MPRFEMPGTHEALSSCCALTLLPDESIKKFERGEQSSKRQKPLGPDCCTPPSKTPPLPPPPPPSKMAEPPAPPPSMGGGGGLPPSGGGPASRAAGAAAVSPGISMILDPWSTIVAFLRGSVYSSQVSALNFSSVVVVGDEPQPA